MVTGQGSKAKPLPGFLLCYQLMTQQLDLKILPADSGKALGAALARVLPKIEVTHTGLMMSILKVQRQNPQLAGLPDYDAEKKKAEAEAKKKQEELKTSESYMAQMQGYVAAGMDQAAFQVRAHLFSLRSTCKQVAIWFCLAMTMAWCLAQRNFMHLVMESLTTMHGAGHIAWPPQPRLYAPPSDVIYTRPDARTMLLKGLSAPRTADMSRASRVLKAVPSVTKGSNSVGFDKQL
eukprot:3504564-Rhodomonas_salina.1